MIPVNHSVGFMHGTGFHVSARTDTLSLEASRIARRERGRKRMRQESSGTVTDFSFPSVYDKLRGILNPFFTYVLVTSLKGAELIFSPASPVVEKSSCQLKVAEAKLASVRRKEPERYAQQVNQVLRRDVLIRHPSRILSQVAT
jgi:hypothetical protein